MEADGNPAGLIAMPRLSDAMEEGTILNWLKSVGDEIVVGDELVEIETDKANMIYESEAPGTLTEILAQEGEIVAIGAPIARLSTHGDPLVGAAPKTVSPPTGADLRPPKEPKSKPTASPVARRIARENGLELSEIEGSGSGGRITKADVQAAIAARHERPVDSKTAPSFASVASSAATVGGKGSDGGERQLIELSKLQQTVARRMAQSKATAPHFALSTEIEMTRAVAARSALTTAAPNGDAVPSFNDMVVKATAVALREHPKANGAYRDGAIELNSRVNVGIAVAADDALVVPTIFDADRKGLRAIAAETRNLTQRTRAGDVTPPELSGGTFTVTNLGMYGIASFQAIINPPQAAILAVGEILEKPVARDGEVQVAAMMNVTLACDHRILYGAEAAEFLARIRALLEEPLGLAL